MAMLLHKIPQLSYQKLVKRASKAILLLLPVTLMSLQVQGAGSNSDLFKTNQSFLDPSSILPVAEAFPFNSVKGKDSLRLMWQVKPGYYLYKDRLTVALGGDSAVLVLPEGKMKDDPHFGLVEVYYSDFETEVAGLKSGMAVEVVYQGCAEVGVCYPPQKVKLQF